MSPRDAVPEAEKRILRVCQALSAVGLVAFAVSLAAGEAVRAWQAYLLNFVFFTGIAQCGPVFSAAYRVSRGRWSDGFRRMAESLGCFLPVSLVLFMVLMVFGSTSVFRWAVHPVAGKELWLNVPFVTLRDFFVLAGVAGLSAAYVYFSQRPALHAASADGRLPGSRWLTHWIAGAGSEEDTRKCSARSGFLAPVLLIAFGLGYSLIGFDLVMSLDPYFYSTLFGWYFFVGAFYAMLAALAVAAVVFRRAWGLDRLLGPDQSHDLGRLLFGFCLLTGGFFWAQWLVFWYGNLPEEIHYVIRRYYEMPFAPAAWTMTYGGFVVPLVILLSKSLKRKPRQLAAIALWILAMMWLERYVWIVPAIWTGPGAPWTIEVLVTAGFLGGFGWTWISHNRRFPLSAFAEPPAAVQH